jgi:outer membrane receptor protein involved in Fe transport
MPLRLFAGKCGAAVCVFAIVAVSILGTGQAYAQVSGATLTGTVKDSSGASLPNAQISIRDLATGVTHNATTDSAGLYTAPNLLPATYEVRVTATGFSTHVQKGITLTVGAQQVLDITMQVGQINQTVEVTTEAPTVELTSSELGATVNATTIRELPLNGRSWTDLANLQPGVVAAETHAAVNVNRGYGAQLSISGARPQQNNYRLDGISINDYANGGPGSVLGQNLGVEAIQEFSVLTSNYSAEYGKTSGGVVNAISRSGTNQFHGSAYEFLRNSALDAPGYFEGGTPPPFKRNQFGASAGGPIRKDHTFVFGDYEGVRQSLGTAVKNKTLSDQARLGILNDSCGNPPGTAYSSPTAFGNCAAPTAGGPDVPNPVFVGSCPSAPGQTMTNRAPGQASTCVDDKVWKYLPMFRGANGGTIGNGNKAYYNYVSQQVVSENYFTTRVDQKFSEKDSLFGTYVYDYSPLTEPDILNNILQQSIAKRQIAAIEENHTFSPTLLNSFRVGYNRDRATAASPVTVLNPVAGDSTQAWALEPIPVGPPRAQGPVTSAPGLTPPTFSYAWNAYQFYDDAFLTRGLHSLKFGFGYERDQLNETTNTADFPGTFKFGSIPTLLTNKPNGVQGVVPGQTTPRYLRLSIVGAYVQDDWRFRPNLTLNLGLRYEMSTVLTETKGKLTNLPTIDAALPTCGILVTGPTPGESCGATGPYFSNPTLRNFEPRVGFAWDPFKNGKTAIRGGFGMFDVLPMLYTTVTLNGRGAPFFRIANSTSLPQGSFPDGALSSIGATKGLEYAYVEPHPHRNYVMQWNLNVQHQIAPSLTAVIGYVGSHGVHQAFRTDDSRIVIPTKTSAGYLWPAGGGTLNNTNDNVGDIRLLDWAGSSSYEALQIGVKKQMSHGLQIQGSYTWGKSIDNNSGVIAGDTLANAISSPHYFDLSLTRGLSDYNIGRVLVVNATWQLPTSKSVPPAVGWAVNGWEVGGILKVNDGPPFTPTWGTGGDPSLSGTTDDFAFPDLLTGPDCQSFVHPGDPNNYIKVGQMVGGKTDTQCFGVPSAPASFAAQCVDPGGETTAPPTGRVYCANLRGNAGRNIIPGPGLVNLDVSFFKNNPIRRISENFNVQFRAEIFNVLNRANFGLPINPDDTDIFDSSGAPNGSAGVITSTTTSARLVQFALKVIW